MVIVVRYYMGYDYRVLEYRGKAILKGNLMITWVMVKG